MFASIRSLLETATTATSAGGVQTAEILPSTVRLHDSGTLDQFLADSGVAALSDDDVAASRKRFEPVMDAWWRQLGSLIWKTKAGEHSGYQQFLEASTDVELDELRDVHPIAQTQFGWWRVGTFARLRELRRERTLRRGHDAVQAVAPERSPPTQAAAFVNARLSMSAHASSSSAHGPPSGPAIPHVESALADSVEAGVSRWVAARQGFAKPEDQTHRNTDAALFLHPGRGRAPFNHCAQKKVVWTFEFKRDMSTWSVRQAEAQIRRGYAAVLDNTRRHFMPLMFAMVSNGALYKLYNLWTGENGCLYVRSTKTLALASTEALEKLALPDSEWCASFGGDAAGAGNGACVGGAGNGAGVGAGAVGADVGGAGGGAGGGADSNVHAATAFAVVFERIARHLASISADSKLPTTETKFVPQSLSLTLPPSKTFANGGTLIVGDVLAVSRRNVVALCEVKVDESTPAKAYVIKMRIDPSGQESVASEVETVQLYEPLFDEFPHPPPKLVCRVYNNALLFERVAGVPISECCTCSAEKRKHVRDLLVSDIAPIRDKLASKRLLYIDWHSGNVLADDAHAPTKLVLIDFESVMAAGAQPNKHLPLRKDVADWTKIDENNWNELLCFYS